MHHNLQIIPIPAFQDNYIWLLHNGINAVIVDPGDAAPVITVLNELNLTLTSILITHHHSDHTDGVAKLLENHPNASVYTPALEAYGFAHTAVAEPNTILLAGLALQFFVLDVPGHTLGHVAYYAPQQRLLFCGDTLFGAGCGRIFEGTAAQMYASLQKLAALAPSTHVYCAHEYTLHNLHFALQYEANNPSLLGRYQQTKKLREKGLASLPTTIALELATNPFLRSNSAQIQSSLKLHNASPIEAFSQLRVLRNLY